MSEKDEMEQRVFIRHLQVASMVFYQNEESVIEKIQVFHPQAHTFFFLYIGTLSCFV